MSAVCAGKNPQPEARGKIEVLLKRLGVARLEAVNLGRRPRAARPRFSSAPRRGTGTPARERGTKIPALPPLGPLWGIFALSLYIIWVKANAGA